MHIGKHNNYESIIKMKMDNVEGTKSNAKSGVPLLVRVSNVICETK